MLKRIPVDQVRLGMYIQRLEGSWLSHPFWKTRFVLTAQADLDALQESDVPYCWIDISKGADVLAVEREPARPDAETQAYADDDDAVDVDPDEAPLPPVTDTWSTEPANPSRCDARREPDRATTLEEEFERARAVVGRSREAVVSLFGEARLGKAIDTESCLPLVEDIASSVARNPSALISLARLKTKDDYTYLHSVAVCALMVSLARQLGLDEALVREAGLAGLLHDIGKMAMPMDVLNKPGALTDPEFAIMRTHPVRGFELLQEGAQVPASALDVALHHHEKFDGTGYPERLSGTGISLLARMGAVCDVYDAVTSHRPYKCAWDPATSLGRMAQWAGHFDPDIFKAFVRGVGIYPVGSLVRLQSGRLAVVVDQNPPSLIAPRVKVFFSTRTNLPVPVEVLDLSRPAEHDRIAQREDPEPRDFTHLQDLWSPQR
jgi:putative nucleotidyltransferase with HDIG domain